ncbi:UDP-N-acetylmuramate dehydrogenase [Duganella qianjiadongensis]|uniref:UDP-N-acetylenolpyruvoylglucosamine reductase n=1 Tax=Duganella qianjiadongensis TaxID=2692176 RepID=A0ABW9VRJ4_9BURK|nr:UDP-N-acetylmuramate dehydrogenase [Duganella qianjiadongensis]MYM41049.1 UDP-N-acetylmuramate dehydrogenase [Duganella qianjiadongensis]
MSSLSAIQYDFPLQTLNTFGIAAKAHAYLRVTKTEQLFGVYADAIWATSSKLILGGGSNLLFTQDFSGLVLHMDLRGREHVRSDAMHHYVRAAAGENWHAFVQWTLVHGYAGLENLSLIPGTAGAAPIQNIGAYGIEVKDVLHSVTVFDAGTRSTREMLAAECRFGYRDSIFKQPEGRDLIVLDVTFALPRAWQPNLRYAELAQALAQQNLAAPTAQQVADTVIAIRRRKLPDPAQIGNAGSFFKNPVVSGAQCAALLQQFPALVHHRQPDGSEKLAAGWLIDQCGWKGRTLGAAGVYPQQALVLVNQGGATGAEVVALARAIQADVQARYGVLLEPEPVFI